MASSTSSATMRELLGDDLLMKSPRGTVEKGSQFHLLGKHVALYFSAHWCPPCRQFTPMLRRTYTKLKGQGQPFEVVYVSSDNNEDQFREYYGEMPWMAVPFDSTRRQALSRRFGISGIPALVILSPEGQVVNSNARSAVSADPEGRAFPWAGGAVAEGGAVNGLSLQKVLVLTAIAWVFFTFILPYLQRKGVFQNE